jgi:hypothetical protein
MYTHAARALDSSIVFADHFPSPPVPNRSVPIRTLGHPLYCQVVRRELQQLKCLISLRTNPVSILSVPIQTVR